MLLTMALGLAAMAANDSYKKKPGHHPACPMKIEGAEVRVDNIESGVVVHITAEDPAVVKNIQDTASRMVQHHSQKKGGAKKEIYSCPMNDYSGSQTKDGRCPKCGMNLEKK
ncbi:MAG: heavy metal-binding domain-containing protein [Elusimicrobiota bacterium]